MPILDIIVPHYREPWAAGSKFFAMLDLQRGIDFDQIHVIVVQDGEEGKLPDECFRGRPYTVDCLTIPHGGVSAARNAGLKFAQDDWVMFCDYDDVFAHVYALRDILSVLPAPGYDLLWADFIAEDRTKDGQTVCHRRGQNFVFIHAKLYRRQFLLENGLFFPEDLEYNEDSAFNAIADTYLETQRVGKIEAALPLYVWCFNAGSATATQGNRGKALAGLYARNKKVCDVFRRRVPFDRYIAMIARTIWDAYHALNVEELTPELEEMREDFKGWYARHKILFDMTDDETMQETGKISALAHTRGDEEEKARWPNEHTTKFLENRSLEEWLKGVETCGM